MFLGVETRRIGQFGGGRRKPNGDLDVAMIQSLVRKGRVNDIVANCGHVVVDECHHSPAVSFERVMREVKARFIIGLTATPHRRDGHHPILRLQLGPVCFTIDPKTHGEALPFLHRLLVRETSFRSEGSKDFRIQEIHRQLAHDHCRNELILGDVIAAVAEGRSPIVLTERRDHLELLAERLKAFVRHLVILRGGMRSRERRSAAEQLASIPEAEERLLLATGRFAGEGFDDARLDTLFLTMPVSWKGTLVQYAGRLHRPHPSKTEVRIYDYVDRQVPMLSRMFDKRMRGYQAMGYREKPHAVSGPPREYTVDRDDSNSLFSGEESP
jgi:superfamily II DNA or RNA helicase